MPFLKRFLANPSDRLEPRQSQDTSISDGLTKAPSVGFLELVDIHAMKRSFGVVSSWFLSISDGETWAIGLAADHVLDGWRHLALDKPLVRIALVHICALNKIDLSTPLSYQTRQTIKQFNGSDRVIVIDSIKFKGFGPLLRLPNGPHPELEGALDDDLHTPLCTLPEPSQIAIERPAKFQAISDSEDGSLNEISDIEEGDVEMNDSADERECRGNRESAEKGIFSAQERIDETTEWINETMQLIYETEGSKQSKNVDSESSERIDETTEEMENIAVKVERAIEKINETMKDLGESPPSDLDSEECLRMLNGSVWGPHRDVMAISDQSLSNPGKHIHLKY